MNTKKYIAILNNYTVSRDNCENGEVAETDYEAPPVKRIRFNDFGELKDELCNRFDENNFYIHHNEDNHYDVLWESSDESGMIAPTADEWEKFVNNRRDLYSCVMRIDIYSLSPVSPEEFADQVD